MKLNKLHKKNRLKKKKDKAQLNVEYKFFEYTNLLEKQGHVEDLCYFLYKKGGKVYADISCGGKLSIRKKNLTPSQLVTILHSLGVQEKKAVKKLIEWEGYDPVTKTFKELY